MNTYEMVERIIELTEKGKIEWKQSLSDDIRRACYKGIVIVFPRMLSFININGVNVNIEKAQVERLWRLTGRQASEKASREKEGKLREAEDILKG